MSASSLFRQAKKITPLAALPAAGFAALAIASINPDTLVVAGFDQALQKSSNVSFAPGSKAPVAGTEEFWLTQHAGTTPAAFPPSVAVGDQISIGSGKTHRNLEVLEVRMVDDGVTRIDTSTGASQLSAVQRLLVICKDPSKSGPEAVVRLMVEPDLRAVSTPADRQRAL
jgi:hypothetical protein